MNTIIIELCAEDRARLDAILEALKGNKPNCHRCTETALRAMNKGIALATQGTQDSPEPAAPETVHPVDEVSPHATTAPAAEPEPVAAPAAPQYTQADILAIVQRLIAPGSTKRAEAKAIVNDYAVKISAIPEDKYPEVMDRLIALEKEG